MFLPDEKVPLYGQITYTDISKATILSYDLISVETQLLGLLSWMHPGLGKRQPDFLSFNSSLKCLNTRLYNGMYFLYIYIVVSFVCFDMVLLFV